MAPGRALNSALTSDTMLDMTRGETVTDMEEQLPMGDFLGLLAGRLMALELFNGEEAERVEVRRAEEGDAAKVESAEEGGSREHDDMMERIGLMGPPKDCSDKGLLSERLLLTATFLRPSLLGLPKTDTPFGEDEGETLRLFDEDETELKAGDIEVSAGGRGVRALAGEREGDGDSPSFLCVSCMFSCMSKRRICCSCKRCECNGSGENRGETAVMLFGDAADR